MGLLSRKLPTTTTDYLYQLVTTNEKRRPEYRLSRHQQRQTNIHPSLFVNCDYVTNSPGYGNTSPIPQKSQRQADVQPSLFVNHDYVTYSQVNGNTSPIPRRQYENHGQYQRQYGTDYIDNRHQQRSSPVRCPPHYEPEPRHEMPYFYGKPNEWEQFWLKFETLSRQHDWDDEMKRDNLMLCMKGDAATYVTSLRSSVRDNLKNFIVKLEERFGHRIPAITYRAKLERVQKLPNESIQEYAARIQVMMSRAYSDIQGTGTYTDIAIQYMLNGLPDSQMAYEIAIRTPTSISEAVDMMTLHEACRENVRKTRDIRNLSKSYVEEDEQDNHITIPLRRLQWKKPFTIRFIKTDNEQLRRASKPRSRGTNETKDIKTEKPNLGYTSKELEELQRQDPDLRHLHEAMDEGKLPDDQKTASLTPAVLNYYANPEKMVRREGVLYQKVRSNHDQREHLLQLLTPEVLRSQVIRDHHVITGRRHVGVNKTSKNIRCHYHWYKMDEDIRIHMKNCYKCCVAKRNLKPTNDDQRKTRDEYHLTCIETDSKGTPATKILKTLMSNETKTKPNVLNRMKMLLSNSPVMANDSRNETEVTFIDISRSCELDVITRHATLAEQ